MNKINDIGTWIHGIGATEDLDSSGERIKIEGVDVSSLVKDGTFNWEHKSDEPNQTVGKIFEVKKIYKPEDCENEHHEYFWKKAGEQPYIYIAGILFDKLQHPGAMAVAAMVKFDKLTDKEQTKHIINFSVEGSRLDKKGVWINKCIARKFTLTHQACNKRCIGEILENPADTKKLTKQSLFDIFKKCEGYSPDLQKDEKNPKEPPKYSTVRADQVKPKESARADYRPVVPRTDHRPGKPIVPKRTFQASDIAPNDKIKVGDRITYQTLRPKTGRDIYRDVKKKSPEGVNPESHERCVLAVKEQGKDVGSAHAVCTSSLKGKKKGKKLLSNMRKALIAGCGAGSAPEARTGMAAVAKESLDKDMKEVFKSISEESFNTFYKKEELITFLKSEFPTLDSNQIGILGKAITYNYNRKKEKILSKLTNLK